MSFPFSQAQPCRIIWSAVCVKNSVSRRRLLWVATTFLASALNFTFRVKMHADVHSSVVTWTLEVMSTSFSHACRRLEVTSLVSLYMSTFRVLTTAFSIFLDVTIHMYIYTQC